MNKRAHRMALFLVILVAGISALPLTAGQTVPGKKPLAYDAYDSWRSIRGTALSRDGAWLVYVLEPQDGDGELVVRNLRSGVEHRAPRGKDPVITADGKARGLHGRAPQGGRR